MHRLLLNCILAAHACLPERIRESSRLAGTAARASLHVAGSSDVQVCRLVVQQRESGL